MYTFFNTLLDFHRTILCRSFHCNETYPVLLVLLTASLEADGGRVRFTGSAEGNSLALLLTLKMMLVVSAFILQPLLRALVAYPDF